MSFAVYFDTSFYVALARASDVDATRALDALDDRDGRVVISFTLMRELLSSADRPARDRILHARVASLRTAPYVTAPDLRWDFLLLEGASRRGFADKLARVDAALVDAESAGVLANPATKHGLKPAAMAHVVAQMPFMNLDGTIDTARLGEFIAPQLAALGVDVPTELTYESLAEVQRALASRFPPGTSEAVAMKSRLTASTVATDNRPYETVLGLASPKARAKLAHTYRDAGHMAEFVAHADAIAAFQMDGPQFALLTQHRDHELRRLGFADRCFAGSGLDDVITQALDIAQRGPA